MNPNATSLGSWIAVLAETIDSLGADARTLLRDAGMDPDRLQDPDARFPVSQALALWELAIAATGEPALGLVVAKRIKPTSFHALGYALMACGSLREMLLWLVRYSRLVSEAGEVRLTIEPQTCHIELHAAGLQSGQFAAIDALMYTIVRSCRLLLAPEVQASFVWMQRPEPADTAPYTKAFRTPMRFAAPANRIEFDAALLDRPSLQANAQLARISEGIAASYLARLNQEDVCNRIRQVLVALMPRGEPSQRQVAQALAMSERSLQRRVADAGSSFRELLNETRREQACMLLRSEQHSVTEIAYMLGFSELSNFTRAFRRWMGCSPSEWRANRR